MFGILWLAQIVNFVSEITNLVENYLSRNYFSTNYLLTTIYYLPKVIICLVAISCKVKSWKNKFNQDELNNSKSSPIVHLDFVPNWFRITFSVCIYSHNKSLLKLTLSLTAINILTKDIALHRRLVRVTLRMPIKLA